MVGSSPMFRPNISFEIEKIIGVCIGSGQMKRYQVQWCPSWINASDLVGCEELIKEFIEQQQLTEPQHQPEQQQQQQQQLLHQIQPQHQPQKPKQKQQQQQLEQPQLQLQQQPQRKPQRKQPQQTPPRQQPLQHSQPPPPPLQYHEGHQEQHYQQQLLPSVALDIDISATSFEPMSMCVESPRHQYPGTLEHVQDRKSRDGTLMPQKIASTANASQLPNKVSPSGAASNSVLIKMERPDSPAKDVWDKENDKLEFEHSNEAELPVSLEKKLRRDTMKNSVQLQVGGRNIGFQCEVCHKVLKQRHSLLYHMSIHNGIKPFACDGCGKRYPLKSELTRHMKSRCKIIVKTP